MEIAGTTLRLWARKGEEPVAAADRYVLRGELEWLIEGSSAELKRIQTSLPGFAEALSDRLLTIDFGNAVGNFKVPLLGRIEVKSGKWSEHDFDQLLLDITEIAAGLPFASRITGALPYDRFALGQEQILYHAFVYLRYALSPDAPFEEQLLPAFRVILSEPHRLFARVRRDRVLFAVSKVDSRMLHNLVSGKSRLGKAPFEKRIIPLAVALAGYLPERVDEPDVQIDYNTAENRFVKRVLEDALWIVEQIREIAGKRKPNEFVSQLVSQCDEMEGKLQPIARDRFWRTVGDMVHVPTGSAVLQRRRGYRQVYKHFIKSRLSSRVPIDSTDLRDLLEAKDIAQLYELWCYFALIREVTKILGPPSKLGRTDSDAMQVSLRWEHETNWSNGTRVVFNPRFSRSRPNARFAYSVPLRPDYAIEVAGGKNEGLHLFDAKFRVERIVAALAEADASDETEQIGREERNGTFKIADLYKMHTYRDSIANARSVCALYPGDRFAFFAATGKFENAIQLPEQLDGVGAIPLSPTAEHPELRIVLEHLLTG